MSFDVFLNFDGDCREALEFYGSVFRAQPSNLQTYDQLPDSSPVDAGRILYASLPVFGSNMMFSDCPSGMTYIAGTNIALTLGTEDEAEIKRLFAELSEGGQVLMDLGPQFFSELFAMVRDRYAITWQLSKTPI